MQSRLANDRVKGEFYDILCFLLLGACIWCVGTRLYLFEVFRGIADRHGLSDFIMLGFCMSFALCAAFHSQATKLHAAIRARDLSKLEAAAVARHDEMTGLANRRHFSELLQARLLRSQRSDVQVAVLLMDLDRFKLVNDVYGHAAGDAVLCAIADRIRAALPPGSVAARLGGDEFGIMTDVEGEVEFLGRLCRTIIAEVSRPVPWHNSECVVGATVGIALSGEEMRDAGALLHAADIAMYQGKKDGRSNFRFFRKDMDESLKARGELEQELRKAIEAGQIVPFYQPLVSLSDKQLIGFEVLARWNHPERGLVTPDKFIQVAEETGMIADLCWSIMRQACIRARSWPPELQLAVNISPQQLQDRQLPEKIMGILNETGFAPGRLEIEITETALIADIEAARKALMSLRALGIRIALDDFGTGYSSLYHLKELKFDKLKIDRSYIATISQDQERSRLVDAIISLGSSLGMSTTAEGIESLTNSDWLAEQGCTYGQGFYFGKPMPSEAVDSFLVRAPEQMISAPTSAAA